MTHFENTTGTCIRANALELGISKSTIQRILVANELHPYHYAKVQGLEEGDRPQRIVFYVINQINADAGFSSQILWSDECIFTRDGCFNCHNSHLWDYENPCAVYVAHYQHHFKVNM